MAAGIGRRAIDAFETGVLTGEHQSYRNESFVARMGASSTKREKFEPALPPEQHRFVNFLAVALGRFHRRFGVAA